MNAKELTLKLHQHFNGDTYTQTQRYKEGERWRYNYHLEPYSDEKRLKDSTYQVFRAQDGNNATAALTYQEIYEALKEILDE